LARTARLHGALSLGRALCMLIFDNRSRVLLIAFIGFFLLGFRIASSTEEFQLDDTGIGRGACRADFPEVTGSTFEVGPGKEYASLRDVPWDSLEPGDLVLVYPQDEPYRDKIQISRSGTPESPIQIRGVSIDGEIPIIDGDGAIENPQASYTYEGFAAMGVFTFVHDKAGNGRALRARH